MILRMCVSSSGGNILRRGNFIYHIRYRIGYAGYQIIPSEINIKNTSVLEQDKIERFPLNFISNQTDRLKVKYSMLVNQYSLNEDEYLYWEKLQNMSEQVGGLYDMIPSAIPSNVYCIDDPNEKVLGYFSVSASSSKRIFIKDHFAGIFTPYTDELCVD